MVFCEVQFLYPSFLWALSLLALPVVIHLFNFRRPKKIVFSDIRFLKQIAFETKKQKQVKHWLILAMRLLMLLFLVLAFAQPFIPIGETKPNSEQLVSVYLDNSYSMYLNGEQSTLLEEAKNKARLLAESYGDGVQYQLFNNNFDPDQVLVLNKKAFLEKIEQTHLTGYSRSAKHIYSKQLAAFQSKFYQHASLYWISDGQKSQFNLANFKQDATLPIHFIPLEPVLKNNIWIDTVWIDEPFIKVNRPFTVHVNVKNNSETAIQNQTLSLLIDHKKVNLQNFSCNANQTELLKFNYTIKDTNWHTATFTLNDYPLVFDDSYHFIVKANAQINVLQLYGNEPNIAFKKLYQLDASYHLLQQPIHKTNPQVFNNQQLIILDCVQQLSSGLEEALLNFMKDGGLVLMLPAKEQSSKNDAFLSKLGLGFGELQRDNIEINEIQTRDELFKQVFTNLSAQTLYPKVSAYFPIESNGNVTVQKIIGMSNGQPYAIRKKFGKGQLVLVATPMLAPEDQFTNHAFFVPFLLNLPFSIKSRQHLAYQANQLKFLPVSVISENNSFTIKKDKRSWQCQASNRAGVYAIEIPTSIQEPGIYNVLNGPDCITKFAINANRTESSLTFNSIETLENAGFILHQENNEAFKTQIQMNLNGHALWRYFLIVALLFLIIEMLLLKYF